MADRRAGGGRCWSAAVQARMARTDGRWLVACRLAKRRSLLPMPVLLRLEQAHKAYADQVVLDAEDLELTDRHRVGVVGRNGAGKSTLCRILLGEEELDSGAVWRADDLRIAYLQQHDPFALDETAIDFLQRDSGQPDWRCGAVAARFALAGPLLEERPLGELSGGWRTRVKLTAMLLAEPDLLVLDEPTNFLDLRTQLLLESFLADWRGAAIIVSHDRTFLQRTCTHTLGLVRGHLELFPGDVEAWLTARAERNERLRRENATILAKRQQLETFIVQNRANPNTAPQARSKAKQLERLVPHDIDETVEQGRIVVPEVPARSGPALHLDSLAIGYDGQAIASGIDLVIDRGERYAVLGDNGQGKTTLLRTLGGSLPPVAGSLRWTQGADLGIYGQHVFGGLPEDRSVLEYLIACAPDDTPSQTVRDVAGTFLFSGDQAEKAIAVLSGGERARLVLAGLLLGRHTVLLLDEPTNHLDVESIEALAEALTRYRGTVLFVSHDRAFARTVATGVLEVGDGRVGYFPDGVASWLEQARAEAAATAPGRHDAPAQTAAAGASDGRRRHELDKAIRAAERQLAKWSTATERLGEDLAACTDPATALRLQDDLAAASRQLDDCETRWLELNDERDRLG